MATYGVAAQDNITAEILPKQRKNEIGILATMPVNSSTGTGSESYGGLQYKRWVKPDFMAYRANIGYGEYLNHSDGIQYRNGDTVFNILSATQLPAIFVGMGIEIQRHFYKRVYMYAAIDLYGGYASGKTNEALDIEVFNNDVSTYRNQTMLSSYNSKYLTLITEKI